MAQTDEGPAQTVASSQAATPPGFEEFFRTKYRRLIGVALLVGASWEEAEDAVDQSMIEVLNRWPDLHKPLAWACKAVVSNFYKQRVRDEKRTEREIKDFGPRRECEEDANLAELEQWQWVEQVLEELPPAQQEVMACVVAGLDTPEICQLLGKNPANVRKHLELARKRLKAYLGLKYESKQEKTTPQLVIPKSREEDDR